MANDGQRRRAWRKIKAILWFPEDEEVTEEEREEA